jgi:hypothetical protein
MTDEKRDGESGEERTTWPVVLFFACLGLGFAASAVEYERVTATAQRDRADVLAAVDSVMEGRMEDLGKFLSNPQTQLIHLASTADSGFAGAVIAWNSSEQRGYLMCDQLPVLEQGDKYEVWAISSADGAVKLASIQAKAGSSIYSFEASGLLGGSVAAKTRVEITAGARSPNKSPMWAGEIE